MFANEKNQALDTLSVHKGNGAFGEYTPQELHWKLSPQRLFQMYNNLNPLPRPASIMLKYCIIILFWNSSTLFPCKSCYCAHIMLI